MPILYCIRDTMHVLGGRLEGRFKAITLKYEVVRPYYPSFFSSLLSIWVVSGLRGRDLGFSLLMTRLSHQVLARYSRLARISRV